MTSPFRPEARKEFTALSTQNASEFASFRQGITTDTSTGRVVSTRSDWACVEVKVAPILATSYRGRRDISRRRAGQAPPYWVLQDTNPRLSSWETTLGHLELQMFVWESSMAVHFISRNRSLNESG